MRLACYRVGACGLETPGRQNRDTEKGTETQNRIEVGGNPVNTEYTHVYFPYTYKPQSKNGGKKSKDCFNMKQRPNRVITFSMPEASSSYFLSWLFCCLGRTCITNLPLWAVLRLKTPSHYTISLDTELVTTPKAKPLVNSLEEERIGLNSLISLLWAPSHTHIYVYVYIVSFVSR